MMGKDMIMTEEKKEVWIQLDKKGAKKGITRQS